MYQLTLRAAERSLAWVLEAGIVFSAAVRSIVRCKEIRNLCAGLAAANWCTHLRTYCMVIRDRWPRAIIHSTDDADQSLPFYMLETKISNRVFARVWEDVWIDIDAVMHQWTEEERGALILRDWTKGAVDQSCLLYTSPSPRD